MSGINIDEIEIGSHSDVGRIRSVNQDRCADFSARDQRLLVVADGMGGHAGGEHASRIAIESIGSVFEEGHADPMELLRRAFTVANESIVNEALQKPELTGMGTTAVALLIGSDGAWSANVGDSRLYRAHAGEIAQLSEDHSVIGAEVRAGRLTVAEAREHPQRNLLLRCLGKPGELDVDIETCECVPGDRFLLCSDGLWGMVEDDQLLVLLLDEAPRTASHELVDLANYGGGEDNITVAIARIPGEPPSPSRKSRKSRWDRWLPWRRN